MSDLPLTGIKVVDFTGVQAGPACILLGDNNQLEKLVQVRADPNLVEPHPAEKTTPSSREAVVSHKSA
ncbi:MAG: hypothetical protein QOJ20_4425 [Mycobacterium sp.]|jgi:hypothetical protein|nr:hypothetical protein [Mycobacterium sp.]MDT5283230.1 hypothetical protein [Mycobacterium sp.]